MGDMVSRIICHGESYEMDLTLDVHRKLFKCKIGDKFVMVLARTVNLDGSLDEDTWDHSDRKTLMDNYEYVMHGKVFKIDQKKSSSDVTVYASFGGLLMGLRGDARNLKQMEQDMS